MITSRDIKDLRAKDIKDSFYRTILTITNDFLCRDYLRIEYLEDIKEYVLSGTFINKGLYYRELKDLKSDLKLFIGFSKLHESKKVFQELLDRAEEDN